MHIARIVPLSLLHAVGIELATGGAQGMSLGPAHARLGIAPLPGMERAAVVYLVKARESLETAVSEFEQGRCNSCANRCYFACFQAAIAALVGEGIRASGNPWSHEFVQAEFNGKLIYRRKKVGADLRRTLAENQLLRNEAGYGTSLVRRVEASRALGKTRRFVEAVANESDEGA